MNIFKTTAAIVVSGLLIGSASLSAWSATADNQAQEKQVQVLAESSAPSALDLTSWLEPSAENTPPKTQAKCGPGRLYSQHDVVGDPEACITGSVSLGTGATPVVPGVP